MYKYLIKLMVGKVLSFQKYKAIQFKNSIVDTMAIYSWWLKSMQRYTFISITFLGLHRTYFRTMDLKCMLIGHTPIVE